jgi:two-component system chemotaxis response regulator CheB
MINEESIHLRKFNKLYPFEAIAISSSTGGPQALQVFFSDIKKSNKNINVPIFITQHIPALFTKYLASHIQESSGLISKEASDNEVVVPGVVYLAPGDFHMKIYKIDNKNVIQLTKESPENYCRPSADPMLRSLSHTYKSRLLSIVLSGMGNDGLKGCEEVVNNSGSVIVQDEYTSVVWGMPGSVAKSGLANAVMPIEKIANFVLSSIVS